MTTAVQRRRGTTVQHSTFTGLEGEVTIDTTKDTIVVHDGSTAGGIPILREDFTNGTVSGLGSINGADTADDDQFLIFDTSTSTIKKISRAELNNAIEQDAIAALTISGNLTLSGGTANGVLYLNGSKVATSGSALTFDGTTFTNTGNTVLGNASTDTVTVNGYMGVGGAGASTVGINVVSAALTGNTQYGIAATPVGTGTTQINGIAAAAGTSNTAFTVANASGFRAINLAKGAASTITSYHGLYVEDLTQGTNNYGITSLVSSGTNKWNIYASGTAANYFAGNVGIGTAASGSAWASTKVVNVGRLGNSVFGTTNDDEINIGANVINTGSGTYIYGATDTASLYRQVAAQHVWYRASSGTAGAAITLNESMRIDSSGNLGLGVTPSAWVTGYSGRVMQIGDAAAFGGSTNDSLSFMSANAFYDSVDSRWEYINTDYATLYEQLDSQHKWYTAPSGTAGNAITFTQAMTLDASGNLLVGTTDSTPVSPGTASGISLQANGQTQCSASSSSALFLNRFTTTGSIASFRYAGTDVGSISVTGSATAYNTSSDYRLKEDIQPMTGALAKVDALKPCTYTWKADGSAGEGFIAHELQEVAPYAVTGEKDGEEMQGVDYGKITPLLTAALQEAIAEIKSLKARVAELEAR